MNQLLEIKKVETEEEWKNLGEFAEGFNHRATDRQLPIFVFVRDGKIRGYAQVHKATPMAITAWHTDKEICNVKDVITGIMHLKGWAKIEKGGGLTAVPVDSPTFTPEVMEKLGLKRLGLELYQFE